MKKFSYLLVLFLLLGQTSCKKEEEESPKSAKDYLTHGVWQGVSYKFTENGNVTDQGSYDDTLNFKDDGRYIFKNAGGNVVEEGDWQLRNSNKEILLESEVGNDYIVDVDRLDDKHFTYHYYYGNERREYNFKQ